MEFGDETVIRQRISIGAQKQQSINNKISIGGIEYTFAPREFEYGFSMVVPEIFGEMPYEIAKRKFSYEDRPKIIISSSDFRVCIAFNCNHNDNKSLDNRLSAYRDYIKKLYPSTVFFTQGICKVPNDIRVAHFDYRYEVIDNDIYNLTFVTDLPNAELLGWFVCPIDFQEKWEPLIRQMIQTIQLIEERV